MTIQEFYKLLNSHDWQYHFSDDHRQWQRGREQRAQILQDLENNKDNPEFEVLFKAFSSWAYDPHGDVSKPNMPEI